MLLVKLPLQLVELVCPCKLQSRRKRDPWMPSKCLCIYMMPHSSEHLYTHIYVIRILSKPGSIWIPWMYLGGVKWQGKHVQSGPGHPKVGITLFPINSFAKELTSLSSYIRQVTFQNTSCGWNPQSQSIIHAMLCYDPMLPSRQKRTTTSRPGRHLLPPPKKMLKPNRYEQGMVVRWLDSWHLNSTKNVLPTQM